MSTTDEILRNLLDRATDPENDTGDELSGQMFCKMVCNDAQLVHRAQELLIAKVRSSDKLEAIRAIMLLEESMTECGSEFLEEAAKFRFLNELIRLVSYKYQGATTPQEVKQRIMECLMLWTTLFADKPKIREAYDMLRKEVGDQFAVAQPSFVMERRESVLGRSDEELFAKLIRSNDPENFKRANLLLRSRMQQKESRRNVTAQHKQSLQEIENTAMLLCQMLDTYDSNNADSVETVRLLYLNCKRLYALSKHLPDLLDPRTDADLYSETQRVHKTVSSILDRYKEVTLPLPKLSGTKEPPKEGPSTTKLIEDIGEDPLATRTKSHAGVAAGSQPNSGTSDPYAELTEIFASLQTDVSMAAPAIPVTPERLYSPHYSTLFANDTNLLEPAAITKPQAAASTTTNGVEQLNDVKATSTVLPEIDSLSATLFHEILPSSERKGTFKCEQSKLSLNDLLRERQLEGIQMQMPAQSSTFEEILVPIAQPEPVQEEEHHADTQTTNAVVSEAANVSTAPRLHLSDISIELDSVTPTGEQTILFDDEDIRIIMNFTADRPNMHVSVLVISAENKSKSVIKDFHFDASVKKPCKVRLLAADSVQMPPRKPFRAAERINQIMLLLNPTGRVTDVSCIVGYRLGDDPDPIKEHFVAKDVPCAD